MSSFFTQSRILMELNYMLSFGAAEPSLCLLQRFHLLEIMLPFQAAYLSQQATRSGQNSMMFMKLFFYLDRLVTCDRPSDSRLWVALLAFHLALVNNPQHPLVVLTFASVLYHEKWGEGVKFARQHAHAPISFVPEISETCDFMVDDELAERVKQLALLVQDSVHILTETDSLLKAMAKFPGFPCSGLVFISKTMGNNVAAVFNVLAKDVASYKKGRKCFEINFDLLGKGIVSEVRLALGKIIMETMSCGVGQGGEIINENFDALPDLENSHAMDKNDDEKRPISPSKSKILQKSARKEKLITDKSNLSEHGIMKKQNAKVKRKLEELAGKDGFMIEKKNQKVAKEQEEVVASQSPHQGIIRLLETITAREKCRLQKQEMMEKKQEVVDNERHKKRVEKSTEVVHEVKCMISQNEGTDEELKSVEKCNPLQGNKSENEKFCLEPPKLVTEKNEKHKKQMLEDGGRRLPLSTLFKRM